MVDTQNLTPEFEGMSEALKRLRSKFVVSCAGRLDELKAATEDLKRDANSADALARIRRESHKIAGLAGSIGFPEIGALAEAVDIELKQDQLPWSVTEPKVHELMANLENMEA